jgi:hypothetical protein
MSYLRKPSPTFPSAKPAALGDLASTISNLASGLGIAVDLANDPYLPETVCRVGQLRDIHAGKKPPVCVRTADKLPGGVGLRKLIKPLRGYIYAEQHKWVYAAGAAAIIGVPLLIGYALGKGKR